MNYLRNKTFIVETGERYYNSANWTGVGYVDLRQGVMQTRYSKEQSWYWPLVGALALCIDGVLLQYVVRIYSVFWQ